MRVWISEVVGIYIYIYTTHESMSACSANGQKPWETHTWRSRRKEEEEEEDDDDDGRTENRESEETPFWLLLWLLALLQQQTKSSRRRPRDRERERENTGYIQERKTGGKKKRCYGRA
jgi:hypothetical protein